jgi:hypothetical protein
VLEMVRPWMEDSESGEKQGNTGTGPASACRGRLRTRPTPSRVPDAVQRERQRSGASLIRDRHGLRRSRVCSAPLRAALRPGHASGMHFGETKPIAVLAKRIEGSFGVVPAHSASLRAFTPVFDGLWTRVNALMLGTHDHRRWLWVPALPSPSRGFGRDDSRFSLEYQPAAVRNDRRRNLLVINNGFYNSNVSGPPRPNVSPPNVSPHMSPRCGTIRRHSSRHPMCHYPSS